MGTLKPVWQVIKNWWHRRYYSPFTVACDISGFAYPGNEREQLFYVNGLVNARRFANQE